MNDTTLASVAGSRRAPDGAAPGGLAAFARALGSKEAGVPRLTLVRALLLPPVHAAPIASRATVQTGAELAQWPDLCERDGVGRLMHEPLIDVVQNRSAPNADVAPRPPDPFYCRHAGARVVKPVALDGAGGLADWARHWARALAGPACAGIAGGRR